MDTIRLAARFMVGNPGDYKYILHVNCPCTLKASYIGTYDTVEQAQKLVPVSSAKKYGNGTRCAKSLPLVEDKPKKTRKPGRRTQFLKNVMDVVLGAEANNCSVGTTPEGLEIHVDRSSTRYTRLAVREINGNSFEINYPFSEKNAKKIVLLLWQLRAEMSI